MKTRTADTRDEIGPKPGMARRLALVAAGLAALAPARAFDFREAPDGVSCRLYDVALGLAWPGGKASWIDAKGTKNGSDAYAVQRLAPDRNGSPVFRWNVSTLVQQWAAGKVPNEGLLIVGVGSPGGGAQFHSRESPAVDLRPSLKVKYGNGAFELLAAAADAVLDCSTHSGLGATPNLTIDATRPALMRFDLARLRKGTAAAVTSAELILIRTDVTPWSYGDFGVFRPVTPFTEADAPVQPGIAAAFSRDLGLEKQPDVWFVDRFADGKIDRRWSPGDPNVKFVVEASRAQAAPGPVPTSSLRATIPRGQNLGLDLRYEFSRQMGREPEAIFLRYYLKLDAAFAQTPDAGKLPGLAGTYGRAGWGGRPWDGQQGWSARGGFLPTPPAGHELRGRVPLGSYVYHSRSETYGDMLSWSGAGGAALLQAERWYCIEQYVKLNTPGREDGILRAWVDGRQVLERTDLRLRDRPDIRIEAAWMDVYFGGTQPAPRDMSVNIANVVIATRYIGPMGP